jgi:hypothetical protein
MQPLLGADAHKRKAFTRLLLYRMKSTFLRSVILLSALTTGACKKDAEPATDAVVVYDPRLCPCCGGFVINFDGSTSSSAAGTKAIVNNADVGISNNDKFPLYVKVDYVNVPGECRPTIKITNLERK